MPRIRGQVTTSSSSEVAVNATTYNEQTSGAQRSIKSASANDAAAGTGARTVLLTYYTLVSGVVAGPFTETLTMNGTAAVATVATNIALVQSLVVLTAGSGGVAAGAISLYTANDGTGTAIAAIASGARQTYLAHAYVPSGQRLFMTDVVLESTEATTVLTSFAARSLSYATANAAEQELGKAFVIKGSQGYQVVVPSPLLSANQLPIVQGPARVVFYVTPGATSSQTSLVDVGYTVST